MAPATDKFFSGLVEFMHSEVEQLSTEEAALVHKGAALALDYFEVHTSDGESRSSNLSEEFYRHVDLFYANPETQAA
ncbi:hypothetical protein [Pseudomonas phage D6]|nr:hypothetical protein [Pseudomonas phage D6]